MNHPFHLYFRACHSIIFFFQGGFLAPDDPCQHLTGVGISSGVFVFILLVEIVVLEGDLAQTNTFSPLNDRVLDLVEFFLRERGGRTHLFSA